MKPAGVRSKTGLGGWLRKQRKHMQVDDDTILTLALDAGFTPSDDFGDDEVLSFAHSLLSLPTAEQACDYEPPIGDPLHDDAYLRGVALGFAEHDERRHTLFGIAYRIQGLMAVPWQPIKSAPKDGTAVLVLLDGSDVPHAVRWLDAGDSRCRDSTFGWHMTWDGYPVGEREPRYWMACPDDPDACSG